jgi:CheY-like chemotaxis protein
LNVLVADDNEYIRELVNRMLEEAGIEFDNAENGLVCLEKLAASSFDVLFLDLIMPEADGEDVLRGLHVSANKNIEVIIMSSQDDDQAIQEIMDLGATAYMTKPLTLDTVKDVIERLQQRKLENDIS